MQIVDVALRRRAEAGEPAIRVAMVGAGFMATGIALQIAGPYRGLIDLVGVATRSPARAERLFAEAGLPAPVTVKGGDDAVARVMADGRPVVTGDPVALARASGYDVLLDVTGAVEGAVAPVLAAIETGRHVVLMNPELDATVGPILRVRADAKGVILTNVEGDQPGVIMNLFRFVSGLGVRPVLAGNIKGFHDPYRTPATQEGFARTWGQNVHMVTSFADGTKIACEQAIVANATGFRVARRGMHGPAVPPGTPISTIADRYPAADLASGQGIVDYVVGAEPAPGVFVIGTIEDPRQRHYLKLYKLGDGPFYVFHTPYHLCHFEVPTTIARAVLFRDAAIAPLRPMVDVAATAKRDLEAGEILDGIGGFCAYGLAENADVAAAERLLPIGVAEGCRLVRAVPRDRVLTYDDVELPPGRLVDRLRVEQATHFAG
jgi:predicted homoserine dehydrogenase-like protein